MRLRPNDDRLGESPSNKARNPLPRVTASTRWDRVRGVEEEGVLLLMRRTRDRSRKNQGSWVVGFCIAAWAVTFPVQA